MKGFTLKWNGKTISGAVRNACSGIIISNKDDIDVLRLYFGGMDEQRSFSEMGAVRILNPEINFR